MLRSFVSFLLMAVALKMTVLPSSPDLIEGLHHEAFPESVQVPEEEMTTGSSPPS